MSAIETIKARYSCRDYSNKKIPKKTIRKLLELANTAPSGCNLQNRHFLVVTNKEDRLFLSEMNNQKHIAQAPVSIIVLTKLDHYSSPQNYLKTMEGFDMTSWGATSSKYEGNRKFIDEYEKFSKMLIPLSDAAAAITTLLLAAKSLDTDSCWVGIFDEEKMKKHFKIPPEYTVTAVVILGKQKEAPTWRADRKDVEELIHWDLWE